MIRRIGFGLLSAVLLVAVFGAGGAYAAGCFTDTNTAAACWLKNNGIVAPYADGSYRPGSPLTRGDAANFLYKANKVPPSAGEIHVSQPLNGVLPNAGYSGTVTYWTNAVILGGPGAGTYTYQVYLTVPTSLYGRATRLKGAQLCYDATDISTSLTDVRLHVWNTAADTGSVTLVSLFDDPTVRKDATCRKYMFAAPFLLAGTHHADLYLTASLTSSSGFVKVTSVTAILGPTTLTSSLSAASGGFFAEDLGSDSGAAP